jgi:hypothetical protein
MRYAIYFTPPADHALTRAAAAWLGRDAFDGKDRETTAEAKQITRDSARRYGFHATLKAPFRLFAVRLEAELIETFDTFCRTHEPLTLENIDLGEVEGFYAILTSQTPSLAAMEQAIVETFEPFRAPLSPDEIAKRRPETLSPAERRNLEIWGYPYVLDTFFFHMTLTDRLPAELRAGARAMLESHFAGLLKRPLPFAGLALCVEPTPGAPFTILRYRALGASSGA